MIPVHTIPVNTSTTNGTSPAATASLIGVVSGRSFLVSSS